MHSGREGGGDGREGTAKGATSVEGNGTGEDGGSVCVCPHSLSQPSNTTKQPLRGEDIENGGGGACAFAFASTSYGKRRVKNGVRGGRERCEGDGGSGRKLDPQEGGGSLHRSARAEFLVHSTAHNNAPKRTSVRKDSKTSGTRTKKPAQQRKKKKPRTHRAWIWSAESSLLTSTYNTPMYSTCAHISGWGGERGMGRTAGKQSPVVDIGSRSPGKSALA